MNINYTTLAKAILKEQAKSAPVETTKVSRKASTKVTKKSSKANDYVKNMVAAAHPADLSVLREVLGLPSGKVTLGSLVGKTFAMTPAGSTAYRAAKWSVRRLLADHGLKFEWAIKADKAKVTLTAAS